MAETPKLHWNCWIHDSPEECAAGKCRGGYWVCPECRRGIMEPDDKGPRPDLAYKSVWRCPECDTFIDFAKMQRDAAPSSEADRG